MCVWGNENMLFYDAKADKLRPLGDAEDEEVRKDWFEESTLVFEGDFSCPEDKPQLVDVVLGLYGFILQVRGTGPTQTSGTQQTTKRISRDRANRKTKDIRQQMASSMLHPLIVKNFQRCFPAEYFHDLPELMQTMLQTDEELKQTVSSRQSQQSLMRQGTYTSREIRSAYGSPSKRQSAVGRFKRWSVTLAHVPPILSGAAAASRRASTAVSKRSSRVVPSIMHAPVPLEASAAASSKASRGVPSPSIPLGPEQLAMASILAARQSVKESVATTRSRGRAGGVIELADLNDSLDT